MHRLKARSPREYSRHAAGRGLPGHIALGVASLTILYWFWPEITYAPIVYNDAVNHIAIIRMIDHVFAQGGNITDFWMPHINFGHALLRSYQFLMHLLIWIAHKTVFSGMTLERCFVSCIALIAMLMPWTFYKGARLLGLSKLESTAAAIATLFIHEGSGYGIGLTNATYSGYGTYNQLLATVLFPLSVGYIHRVIREDRSKFVASVCYAAMFMSHILTGYFALLWIAVDVLYALIVERRNFKKLALSLLIFGGMVLLWTCHWLIPMMLDTVYQHRSQYELEFKWTGYGAVKMLTDFATGENMDSGRLPILTALAGFGLVLCALKRSRRILAVQSVFWILISFGTLTWGSLLSALPMAKFLHWHRAFAMAQVALCFCIGISIEAIWNWLNPATVAGKKVLKANFGAGVALIVALAFPCIQERQKFFYYTNDYWLNEAKSSWDNTKTNYHAALEFAQTHGDARYNLGSPFSWGHQLLVTHYIPWYGLLTQFNTEVIGAIHHHQSFTELFAFNLDWKNKDHNELANIRYVALPSDPKSGLLPLPNYKPLLTTSNGILYDNGNTSGYFGVGTEVDGGCADNESMVRAVPYYLKSQLVARHIYPKILLAKSCAGKPAIIDSTLNTFEKLNFEMPGKVLESTKKPGPESDIHSARVHMDKPGVLVFKMNFHPDWQALVNGKLVKTDMIMPAFTGVPLQAGDYQVELFYKPDKLKIILTWLSCISFLGALIALGFLNKNKFESKKHEARV